MAKTSTTSRLALGDEVLGVVQHPLAIAPTAVVFVPWSDRGPARQRKHQCASDARSAASRASARRFRSAGSIADSESAPKITPFDAPRARSPRQPRVVTCRCQHPPALGTATPDARSPACDDLARNAMLAIDLRGTLAISWWPAAPRVAISCPGHTGPWAAYVSAFAILARCITVAAEWGAFGDASAVSGERDLG